MHAKDSSCEKLAGINCDYKTRYTRKICTNMGLTKPRTLMNAFSMTKFSYSEAAVPRCS